MDMEGSCNTKSGASFEKGNGHRLDIECAKSSSEKRGNICFMRPRMARLIGDVYKTLFAGLELTQG